jgi:hypothetical protein
LRLVGLNISPLILETPCQGFGQFLGVKHWKSVFTQKFLVSKDCVCVFEVDVGDPQILNWDDKTNLGFDIPNFGKYT